MYNMIHRRGVVSLLCVALSVVIASMASLTQSQLAHLVRFDWAWKTVANSPEGVPGEAPFWCSQAEWQDILRARGLFVINVGESGFTVKDSASVRQYLEEAAASPAGTESRFTPPDFHGESLSSDGFAKLSRDFGLWLQSRAPRMTLQGIQQGAPAGPAPEPATTASVARRELVETTTPVNNPAPESTTSPEPPTTSQGEAPTTAEVIVYPAYYDSCDWTTRPDPPACDNGWNACQDPQCDDVVAEVAHRPVCVCTDQEMLDGECVFFQCDTDSDGLADSCMTDSNADGIIDHSDDDCGSKDDDGVGIPNSMVVCDAYQSVCTAFECHCSQDCNQFNDCCEDFDDFCAACSCGPYADDCCCDVGQYNGDCDGLLGFCNCLNCTCTPGEYFYSSSLTDTCLSKACEPASCSAGEYLADCECQTGTVNSKPGTCAACITSCDVGQFMNGTCDGTTIEDVKVCTNCTASGECEDKHYYDGSQCQGDSYSDDTCIPCTASGSCEVGEFYDATQCLGDGFNDTTCQPCTALGSCDAGFYFDATNCQGDTEEDDACVACTTEGSCIIRTYFDSAKCAGNGTSDDSCVDCTPLGGCPANTYWDVNFCDGTGSTNDQCQACTALGSCPDDHYFDASNCDGSGTSDDACVECTASGACSSGYYYNASTCANGEGDIDSCWACTTTGNCPSGYFFNSANCDGTGTSDDSCEQCTSDGGCAVGYFFDATICASGDSEVDSCSQCSTSCSTGYFYDNTQCQGDGNTDDTCVLCASVFPNCTACSSSATCATCADGYTLMDDSWLNATLADGTVVAVDNMYGHCLDVDPPELSNCPPEVKIKADGVVQIYYAHWRSPLSAAPLEALDEIDGDVVPECTPISSGDSVGTYDAPFAPFNVTCVASDDSENKANCTFLVEIIDSTAPVFQNCPENVVAHAAYGAITAAATWTEPTAVDDVDGGVPVYGSDFPGDEFPVGNHSVTYYSVDLSGNSAFCRFYVAVDADGTTTPDPSVAGFGESSLAVNESSALIEDAVNDIVNVEAQQQQIQQDSDSDGLGTVETSTRIATTKMVITFDSFCSDEDEDAAPDTSDLSVVGGMIEAFLDDLGLVADSVEMNEACGPAEINTQLSIVFAGPATDDGGYDTLESDIAAEVASTLGLLSADVTVTKPIRGSLSLEVSVTSEERYADDTLASLLSNVNSNTDAGTLDIGPATEITAWEIVVFNDMATDVVLTLEGSYSDGADYTSLQEALAAELAQLLDINAADVTVLSSIDSGAELRLRVITAGYSSSIDTAATLEALNDVAVDEGYDGVDDIDTTRLVATEVKLDFSGNQTDGGDYSALEEEILTHVSANLGLDNSSVLLEESIVNSRVVLLIYSSAALATDDAYTIIDAVNDDTSVASTDLVLAKIITLNRLSATEADSRNQLVFTIVGDTFASEQIDVDDVLLAINAAGVLSSFENQDGQLVGSARSGYFVEDDEVWNTVMAFAFDEPYDAERDYSTHEFMALRAIAATLGIDEFDIETVSIGDDGSGNLEILFDFSTSFEVTSADRANIVAQFFSTNVDCLTNSTDINKLLTGIEFLFASEVRLSAAQKQLCVVQYFSNYQANTVTQWQDDSGSVNYYISSTRTTWSQRATEQKDFAFGSGDTKNIVRRIRIGGLVGSDTANVAVTTIPQGKAFEVTGASIEESVAGTLLDRYVLAAIELFDANGQYEQRDVPVSFCLSSPDESLSVAAFRLPVGKSEWEEVTNIEKVSAYCYVVTTPLCILAIGVNTGETYTPQYQQRLSASSYYSQVVLGSADAAMEGAYATDRMTPAGRVDEHLTEYFATRGDAVVPESECAAPYYGVDCEKRSCAWALSQTSDYFANSVDVLFAPCLSGEDDVGCSHAYAECGGVGTCDEGTGECACPAGYTGSGCRYRDCPRDAETGLACSGHGVCQSGDFSRTGSLSSSPQQALDLMTSSWASPKSLQCNCDSGYFGPDCSKRYCARGADPHKSCPLEVAPDVHDVDVSALDPTSWFTLVFTDIQGSQWRASPVPQTAAARQVQEALLSLPNDVIPSVDVTKDEALEVFHVTFSDSHNAGMQSLLQCNPPSAQPTCWQTYEIGGNVPLFSWSGNCTVTRGGSVVSDPDSYVYDEHTECASRGNCNRKTGLCECFDGHAGLACQSVLRMF